MFGIEWEDVWKFIGISVVIALVVLFGKLFTADHSIRSYYLQNDCGVLKIKADIDWQDDQTIQLDRTITMDSAIVLVKELNETLKK